MLKHSGSCLCQSVQYALLMDVDSIELCCCSICRKAHAAQMTPGSTVPASYFQITKGHEQLRYFESSPGKQRYFCQNCGTHLYALRPEQPENIRLRVATLDTELQNPKVKHIYTEDCVSWYRKHIGES